MAQNKFVPQQPYSVYCANEKCKAEFVITLDMIRQRTIAMTNGNNKITESYFVCPSCGQHYTIGVTDYTLLKRKQKAAELAEKIRVERDPRKRQRLFKKYQAFVRTSESMSAGLQKSWKSTIEALNLEDKT